MTSLSDTLTVGLVLVLLFGSIALYLYTRIQQAEQKISLLESILLDLKMSAEVKSYSELPAETVSVKVGGTTESYIPFNEDDDEEEEGHTELKNSSDNYFSESAAVKSGNSTPSVSESVHDTGDVEQYKSVIAEAVKDENENEHEVKVSANYEAMTLKELQTLAKSRGITGASSMKKNAIIEALKTSDRSSEPGPIQAGSSAFLETSSPFLAASPVVESQ